MRKARAGRQVLGYCSGADKSFYLPLLSFSRCHQHVGVTGLSLLSPEHLLSVAADLYQTDGRQLCWFSYPYSKECGMVCFLHFLLKRGFYQNKSLPGEFSSSVSLPLYQRINTNSTVTFLTNIRGLQVMLGWKHSTGQTTSCHQSSASHSLVHFKWICQMQSVHPLCSSVMS